MLLSTYRVLSKHGTRSHVLGYIQLEGAVNTSPRCFESKFLKSSLRTRSLDVGNLRLFCSSTAPPLASLPLLGPPLYVGFTSSSWMPHGHRMAAAAPAIITLHRQVAGKPMASSSIFYSGSAQETSPYTSLGLNGPYCCPQQPWSWERGLASL